MKRECLHGHDRADKQAIVDCHLSCERSITSLDSSWLFAAQNDVHEVTAFHVLQVSKANDADMLACPYLSRTLGLRSSQSLLRELKIPTRGPE